MQFEDYIGEGFMGVDKLVPIKREIHKYKCEKGEHKNEVFWRTQFNLTLG